MRSGKYGGFIAGCCWLFALSGAVCLGADDAVRPIAFQPAEQGDTCKEQSTLVAVERRLPPLQQPELVLTAFEEPASPVERAASVVPAALAQAAPLLSADAVSVPSVESSSAPAPSAFPRLGSTASHAVQPLVEPRVTNQTRHALSFYGGYSARATLSQLPRRAPLQPGATQPVRRQAKPFQSIRHEPTVSPYLNLYRNEDGTESAPNYFALVRPQMDQLDANRLQQREIQQLRGQVQSVSSTVAGPRYQPSGLPGTGTPARYMDTAQFYGGWSR